MAEASLGRWIRFRNGRSSPIRTIGGAFDVYGSNGIIGRADVANVESESIVIGRVGSYCGSTYFAPNPCWVTDNAIIATVEAEDETRFWYFVLKSLRLNELRQGSGQPLLNQSILSSVPFNAPPRQTRLSISATLGALDDKIESNNRLLDVVPALIAGHVARALEHACVPVSVAGLARFVNGGAYTKGASGNGRMVLRIAELNSGPGASTVYSDIEVPAEKTAYPGDLLMSWSGSLGVYRWFRDEAVINQHIFKVIPTGYPAWLVFNRLEAAMPTFRGIAQDKATTMGHIQRGHLESTEVDMPTPEAVKELDVKLGPLWERLLLADRENVKLAALRDTLLPELLSGRASGADVEQSRVEVVA